MSTMNLSQYSSMEPLLKTYLKRFRLDISGNSPKLSYLPEGYAGEVLERYVEHDVKNDEKEMEMLMTAATYGIMGQFTNYGNQLEDGLRNFRQTAQQFNDNYLMKAMLHVYRFYVEEVVIPQKNNTHVETRIHSFQDPVLIDYIKQMTPEQIGLMVKASNISLSYNYDETLGKGFSSQIGGLLHGVTSLLTNVLYSLDEKRFNQLDQETRILIVMWAGISKKGMNLLKKHTKNHPFFESMIHYSNELLRDKIRASSQNPFLSELEAMTLLHLAIDYRLLKMPSSERRNEAERQFLQAVNQYQNELTVESAFIIKRAIASRWRFHITSVDREYILNIMQYVRINDVTVTLETDEEKKAFNELYLEMMAEKENREASFHEYYFKLELFKNATKDELLRVIKETFAIMDEMDEGDKKNSSYTSHYKSSLERAMGTERLILHLLDNVKLSVDDELFAHPLFHTSLISGLVKYADTIFLNLYKELPKNILNAVLVHEKFKEGILLNVLKKVKETAEADTILYDFLYAKERFDPLVFAQLVTNIYFSLTKEEESTNQALVSPAAKQELHQSILLFKSFDEELIPSTYRKFFVSTVEDAKEAIRNLSFSHISSYGNLNPGVIEELMKAIDISLLKEPEVQTVLVQSLEAKVFDLRSFDDIEDINRARKFRKFLYSKDILTPSSIEQLDEVYERYVLACSDSKYVEACKEIIRIQNKQKEMKATEMAEAI